MSDIRLTHIGGPTVLIEVGPWRILTDPTFDPPGKRYPFALGTSSVKVRGPAVPVHELPPIDVVLLTHDHHADNLDDAGREVVRSAREIVTTVPGAERLGGAAHGLAPWVTHKLERAGYPTIEVTATPCRHGPPASRWLVGHVIGFALKWAGQQHGDFWISGDTVFYHGIQEVASRLRVGTAILHLGEVRFPLTGPIRYTMTAADAIRICSLVQPNVAIPVHYEGWSHFHEGKSAIERTFAASAKSAVAGRIRWIPLGAQTVVST
jgi:L-ascorbate metabolism protein UlaG (beta-lactamase superfamily)